MSLHPSELPWQAPPRGDHPLRRLSVRWLGTAGYELSAEGTTVLIDPYLTRVSLWRYLFSRISPAASRVRQWVTRADAVLVGHSHFDHVMDVPLIAMLTGATVYGSRSTSTLCGTAGVRPDRMVTFPERGLEFELGPFHVRAVPSEHSRFYFGRIPYPGEIPPTCELPMRGSRYRCGQVFSFHIRVGRLSLYHCGSANLLDDAISLGSSDGVDALLVCIAGRASTERLMPRLFRQLSPRRVVPMHYDNFFRPLGSPMGLLPDTRFGRFVDDVQRVSRETPVSTLEPGSAIELAY